MVSDLGLLFLLFLYRHIVLLAGHGVHDVALLLAVFLRVLLRLIAVLVVVLIENVPSNFISTFLNQNYLIFLCWKDDCFNHVLYIRYLTVKHEH